MKEPKRWENFHVHKPEARAGMYNPLGRGLGIIRSFLLPLYTVVRPREAYRRLRHVVKKSSPIMRLMLVFWAYIGFAFLSMIAVFFGSLYYSITHVSGFSLTGLFGGMWSLFKAMIIYPFLAPFLLAAVDTALMIGPARIMEKEPPNYLGIMLVRFSSLIGYTVKPGLLAVTESPSSLTLLSIYSAHPSNTISVAVLVFTYIMTAYGLVRGGGLSWRTGLTASAVPSLVHLAVGLLV